ncbi:MAG: putative metal-binding motif-containing protein [Deltaproteobacteria bacterium]|nr:putative metal-binding motif-containing protein [Deltaproteobacteria bacterium]
MFVCASCSSFVPPASRACPACGQALTPALRAIGGVVTLAGTSLFAMTLSACYGVAGPPPSFRDAGPQPDAAGATCDDVTADLDGDGYCGELDCDEANASINDGATDTPGDGVDSNCDGAD